MTAHSKPVQAALPAWAPPIGSTVYLPLYGVRKPSIPHTIAAYMQGPSGEWVFKAYDFAGWSYLDSIDTLSR